MNSISGSGIMEAFQSGFSAIDTQAANIRSKMAEIQNNPNADNTVKMMELQMMMGRYNSMIELTSNISKTICDTAKSLAQKIS